MSALKMLKILPNVYLLCMCIRKRSLTMIIIRQQASLPRCLVHDNSAATGNAASKAKIINVQSRKTHTITTQETDDTTRITKLYSWPLSLFYFQ